MPPVTLKRIPVAPSNGELKRGFASAARAASMAAHLPLPSPYAINAEPPSPITERTSAKSTLIMPGTVMMSDMPFTPCRSTSSAASNARSRVTFPLRDGSSLSFSTTMSVSTFALRLRSPCSATSRRREPSNENGSVTTPTVSAPFLRAMSATVADAPVPVPPPIPAVINTISEPSRSSAMCSWLSFTARRPTSGRPPDPMPFTAWGPMAYEGMDLRCANA